jgi:hypothetical protein
MTKATRYRAELRERPIRMVRGHRDEHTSEWAVSGSTVRKPGMTPETLRLWVRQDAVDQGRRPAVTSAERAGAGVHLVYLADWAAGSHRAIRARRARAGWLRGYSGLPSG